MVHAIAYAAVIEIVLSRVDWLFLNDGIWRTKLRNSDRIYHANLFGDFAPQQRLPSHTTNKPC
jgi:hypothetical protein